MAKQKTGKHQPSPPPKKPAAAKSDDGTFSYLWRNGVIIMVLLIIAFIFSNMFSKERELSKLTDEFYQLRAQNPRSPELRNVYDQIMQLQPDVIADTGYLTRVMRGYNWAINDLALGSYKNIEQIKEEMSRNREDSTPQAALEAKMSRKVGLYALFNYINQNTPKDAVIFIPGGDSAMWNNSKWNYIYEPEWVEYFIYPRLCVVIGKEKDHPDLAKRATHVLIVEGKGYEKLKYDVPMDSRVPEGIFPIDHPPGADKKQGS